MTARNPKSSLNPLARILKTIKGDCEIKVVLARDDTVLHVSIDNLTHSLDCKITHQKNAIPSQVISSCCLYYCEQNPSMLDPITADLRALMSFLDGCEQATFSALPFADAGWPKPAIHEVVYG